jgi:hypothetical protein
VHSDISARTITSALKRHVFPVLKAAGFDETTSRRAWRHRDCGIDCVEFRSYNCHYADKFDCTTASVSVWIGSWPAVAPPLEFAKQGKHNTAIPEESEMPIRGQLAPSEGYGLRHRHNIWVIRKPQDAETAALDIAAQFQRYGLCWLDTEWSADALLDILKQHAVFNAQLQNMPNGAHQYLDAGNPGSPRSNRMMGYVALATQDYALAAETFERARWATGHPVPRLYLDDADDQILRDLVEHCKALAAAQSATKR